MSEQELKQKMQKAIGTYNNDLTESITEECVKIAIDYKNQCLRLHNVVGRSEQLLVFARYVMPDNFTDKALKNIVAQFLKDKQFCSCSFAMIMRDPISDIPFCSECELEVIE